MFDTDGPVVIIYVLLALIAWDFAGCVALGLIDDQDQSLLKWAKECPYGLTCITMLWPLVLFAYWWCSRQRK